MRDRTLYALTFLAVAMSLGHHLDHVIRSNAVGWPITDDVNAFSASLVIYPIIAAGLWLYHTGRAGPGFWAFLSGGGATFVGAVHIGPQAPEPPSLILDHYHEPAAGLFAFSWLLAFIAVLLITFAYEVRQWLHSRNASRLVDAA